MSLSSLFVVSNALRLRFFHVLKKPEVMTREEAVSDKNVVNKEEMNMYTMKIEGMMCGHCEASVKKALEALAEVEAAEVSHEKGTAVVTLRSEVSDEVLKKAVEEKDYTVVEIR